MDNSQNKEFWLTLLFRGSKLSPEDADDFQPDEYVDTFQRNNLIAINLPILEFAFTNLDRLEAILNDLPTPGNGQINGLIITSPRVVRALELTMQQMVCKESCAMLQRIDERFVFVIGEKSGKVFQDKLGLSFNLESINTGRGQALADYITNFCDNHPNIVQFNLIYPKGNLTDWTIESALDGRRIKLISIVVYETNANSSIESDIVDCFKCLHIPDDATRVMINHTFFSPSGFDSFRRMNLEWYRDFVKGSLITKKVNFCYSAIGKTTEATLTGNNFRVFSVAEKPNATCLVESLKNKISCRSDGDSESIDE